MKISILGSWFTEHLSAFFIIILFIWISFFPAPIQQSYYLDTYIFLGAMFLITFEQKRISIFKSGYYPLWIFLIAISLNVFSARDKTVAFRTYLDLAIPLLCIYYTLSEGMTSKQFDTLSKVICVVSIAVAFWGLMDFFLGVNWLYEYFIPNPYYQNYKSTSFLRPISTQFHNPPLGTYLIASLPFNLLLIRQSKLFFKSLGFIGALLGCVVIIMTFSRGAFLGFVTMVLFILYFNKKHRLLLIFFIIFCLFILLCSHIYNPLNRLGFKQLTFYGIHPIFSKYRLNRFIMTLRMFKDHPFIGLGLQHFRILFNEYFSGRGINSFEFKIADNMYLTLLSETGILGFIGFLIFIFSVIKKAWKKITAEIYASSNRQQLVLVFSALIGLLVHMGAYELFYWPNQYMCFCILIGCMNALLKFKDELKFKITISK